MKRIILLQIIAATLTGCFLAPQEKPRTPAQTVAKQAPAEALAGEIDVGEMEMNFIIIMCDSFRFDALAAYTGNRPRFRAPAGEVDTPHIDRFAGKSTVFERCYVASYPTVQNRKDLFTGKIIFPFEGWSPLDSKAVTFSKRLNDAGYWTQMIQDTPHTLLNGFNFQRDFKGWQFIRGQETDKVGPRPQPQPGMENKARGQSNWSRHLGNIRELRRFEQDCFVAQTMTEATHWLERNHDLGKFFLYIDTFDPHEPWDAPRWYEEAYNPGYDGESYRYPVYGKADVYSKAELDQIRAMYAAEATLVDRWVGSLLESVERMGLMDNTCVMFMADHGVSTGDHGWTGKNAMPMYEIVAHVPMMIHLPGQTRSRRIRELVQHCDIVPTMLDLAGRDIPEGLSGVSLRPALEGKPMETRPFIFTRGNGGLLITSDEWSLVYPVTSGDKRKEARPSLFHLPTDPCQTNDVLDENLEVAREMYDAYDAWMVERKGQPNADAPMRP
jgi:arylsulfatase A-like enzyme